MALAGYPLFAGGLAGPGRAAHLRSRGNAANQSGKSLQGIRAVPFLGAEALGLEDNDPVGRKPAVMQQEEALLVKVREGGGCHRKTQVDGSGDLVDILAAGTLGGNGGQLDFA